MIFPQPNELLPLLLSSPFVFFFSQNLLSPKFISSLLISILSQFAFSCPISAFLIFFPRT